MISILNKIYQSYIIRYPIYVIISLVLVLSFFTIHAKNFELDASADSLILEDDQDLKTFREISNRYESKDFVIITYKPNDDLFSFNSFENIKNLKEKLENLENVHEVITLIDLPLLKAANVPLKKLNEDKIKNWKRFEVIKDYRIYIVCANMLAMPSIATGTFVYQSFILSSKNWGPYVIAQSFMVYSILSVITLFFSGFLIDKFTSRKILIYMNIPLLLAVMVLIFFLRFNRDN